jgi:anti-sigma B factor antagonist
MTNGRKAAYMPRRHIAAPGARTAAAHRCAVRPADTPQAVTLDVSTAGPQGHTAVVKVSGEIDLRTAQALKTGLLDLVQAGFGRIVVDFGDVRFCDATGLGALVAAQNRLAPDAGGLRLAGVRPAQRRLFGITGLDRLFVLYDNVEEAVREDRPSTAAPRG